MVEFSKRCLIKKHIKSLLTEFPQLTRAEIIEKILYLASEPTIQSAIKEMISEGVVEEFEMQRQKNSKGGRPPKYYQLKSVSFSGIGSTEAGDVWETLDGLDGYCISCIHWGKIAPSRQRLGLSPDFFSFRANGEPSYSNWCEIWDKPMFHDENCLKFHPMKGLHTFTFKKGATEIPVGFNGRVSIDENDDYYLAKVFTQDSFIVVQHITQEGEHSCYRIYPDLTKTPYPCNSDKCTINRIL